MEEEKWKVAGHAILSINLSHKRRRKDLGMRGGSIGRGFHFGKKEGCCFHSKSNPSFSPLFEHWKNICLIPRFLEFWALSTILFFFFFLLRVAHQSCIQVLSVV